MNPAQISLYWREWAAARAALIALGFIPKEADLKRHELHIRALGRDVSHKDFLDADFTKVLGVFRSYSQPANLREQIRVIEEPEHRTADLLEESRKQAAAAGIEPHGIEAYLDSISRRVIRKPLARLNQIEAARLRGIIALQAKRHREAAGNPF